MPRAVGEWIGRNDDAMPGQLVLLRLTALDQHALGAAEFVRARSLTGDTR